MELLNKRFNGNAEIELYDDGTRIIQWSDGEEINLDYPVSIDLNISNRCDNGCEFCYQNCSVVGKQANLKDMDYLKELPSGTEIAINLQRPLPDNLEEFLINMAMSGLIINCTINQRHLGSDAIYEKVKQWQDMGLIHGIGVSVTNLETLDDVVKGLDTSKINLHMINGIHTIDDILLASRKYKVLILGYKMVGRGPEARSYNKSINQNIAIMNLTIDRLIDEHINEIAFDNLALEQIDIRNNIAKEQWDDSYQGDDGSISFYINAVDRTYAINSLVPQDEMKPIGDKTLKEIFAIIKEERNEKLL